MSVRAPEPRRHAAIDSLQRMLRDGDLVFRRGASLVSRAVLSADTGFPFSHVGLYSSTGGGTVIHVAPGDEHDVGVTVMEPLDRYLAPGRASEVGAWRVDGGDPARAVATARGFVARRIPFDHNGDTGDRRSLYCTELVWLAWRDADAELLAPVRTPVRIGHLTISVIRPSELVATGATRPIARFTLDSTDP
jgi:hypothetical protein